MKAVCKSRILKIFAYFAVCVDIPNWIIFLLLHKCDTSRVCNVYFKNLYGVVYENLLNLEHECYCQETSCDIQ